MISDRMLRTSVKSNIGNGFAQLEKRAQSVLLSSNMLNSTQTDNMRFLNNNLVAAAKRATLDSSPYKKQMVPTFILDEMRNYKTYIMP